MRLTGWGRSVSSQGSKYMSQPTEPTGGAAEYRLLGRDLADYVPSKHVDRLKRDEELTNYSRAVDAITASMLGG